MKTLLQQLRDPKYIGQEGMRHQAADAIEELQRDHIGAHRVSGLTIRHLEGVIEALREQLLETQRLSFDWMTKHDKLLGFVQARPDVLKELIAVEQSDKAT